MINLGSTAGILIAALLSVPHASCHSRSAASPATDSTPIHVGNAAAAAVASNRFGFDVYARLRAPNENLIFSPISASLALGMAAAGAKGETLSQMSRVLHVDTLAGAHAAFAHLLAALPDAPETEDKEEKTQEPSIESVMSDGGQQVRPTVRRAGPPVLHIADRVWAQAHWTYREDFLSILRDSYRASLGLEDFAAAPDAACADINQWVNQQTRGRIQNLLPRGSIDPLTRLVLTNAVYFKGAWGLPFAPSDTRDEDFVTPHGKARAPMMRHVTHFRYAKAEGLAIVELHYFGGTISMLVVLPNDEDGLADVEDRMGHEYEKWVAALSPALVDLWLPRWKETRLFALDEILKALGMPLPFTRHADFSGMTDMPTQDPGKFYIGTVIQKAFVNADEVGTEAAAATAVVMSHVLSHALETVPEQKVVFHADHPFLYVVREERTGAVLFVGRVVDPR